MIHFKDLAVSSSLEVQTVLGLCNFLQRAGTFVKRLAQRADQILLKVLVCPELTLLHKD